jgi:hypothetical protein
MKIKILIFLLLTLISNLFLGAESVDFSTCRKVAHNKLVQLGKTLDFSIEKAEKIIDESNGSSLFFVFELAPQGYIVATCETNLPPIIAYSFTSKFKHDESGNVLLKMLKADIQLRLQNIPNVPEQILTERNESWSELLNQTYRTDRFEQWPPEGTTPTGGWLLSNWTQTAPYNNLCPVDPVTGIRSYAGCPSIAMAQILDYHRTTNQVSFNDSDDYYHNYAGRQYWIDNDYLQHQFPSFPQLNDYLATLAEHYLFEMPVTNTDKAALVFACGVAATQVYTSQGSGTFGVAQAYEAYQKFNFSDISLLDSSSPNIYEQISQNIKDALPVHFASVTPQWDSGHNFVVDGYNTDAYYHINFGWGGSYNGWYLLPDEIPYGLTVLEGAVVDIVPNSLPQGFINGQITLVPEVVDSLLITLTIKNLADEFLLELEPTIYGTANYIIQVPIGVYSVTASYPGYETISADPILVEELGMTTVDFTLSAILAPTELTGEINGNDVILQWLHPQTRGFQYFNIYRNINSTAYTLLDTTSQTSYPDFVNPPQNLTYGYYVTAVYANENVSAASNEIYINYIVSSAENDIISISSFTNYPNPFNPSTTIQFSSEMFEQGENISINIYNIKGQKVRQFNIQNSQFIINEVVWNGTDNQQNPVSSGVYFYQIKSENVTSSMKKMLLLK